MILASDKTQLTNFSGGKSAYPVYLTIGNLPKALRRRSNSQACVLIAYLSTNKPGKKKGFSKKTLRLRNYELFHRSMAEVLSPLKQAGLHGAVMTGGNGEQRMVHPIISSYVADYPEQCLVACAKYGTCPKCRVKATQLQDKVLHCKPRSQRWTEKIIRNARLGTKSPNAAYTRAMEDDVAGGSYDPFWKDFPYCDIHNAIAPDVLHQLFQGIIKHLIAWIQFLMTEDEFDSRLQSLPPALGVRHFKDGISKLSQVTGPERKNLAKILIACLVGKIPSDGIFAARALLDFILLAQYPSHDGRTLKYMQDALDTWHLKRDYFLQSGVRRDFNIPKFHSLLHYIPSIESQGTTDNVNTEMFEHLHITFAKDGWRASNKRNAFPQMINWLSRQEKVASYDFFRKEKSRIELEEEEDLMPVTVINVDEEVVTVIDEKEAVVPKKVNLGIRLAKRAPESKKHIEKIARDHCAPTFIAVLKLFLNGLRPAPLLRAMALEAPLVFDSLDIWHQVKISPTSLFEDEEYMETVKAVPIWKGSEVSRFDTVLVMDSDTAESTGVAGKKTITIDCRDLTLCV